MKQIILKKKNGRRKVYNLKKIWKNGKGPALLVYDSAVFTDNDFENITRIGKK